MPLWAKVEATKIRLVEFYNHYNGNVTISYSGGKDSTVLAYIANDMLGLNIPLVFSNTGLEYAQIQKFARAKGAEFIRPEMLFSEVISQYGYPIISKVVSEAIYYARRIPKDTTPPPCWCREHLLGRATMPERQYAESNASRTIQRMVREPSQGGGGSPYRLRSQILGKYDQYLNNRWRDRATQEPTHGTISGMATEQGKPQQNRLGGAVSSSNSSDSETQNSEPG